MLLGRPAGPGSAAPASEGADGGSTAPEQRLVFSPRCGRVRLSNVTVRNAGIDWADPSNVYWRHMVRPRPPFWVPSRIQAAFHGLERL